MINVPRRVLFLLSLSLILVSKPQADALYRYQSSSKSTLQRRAPALENSPSGSYAPSVVQCPPGLRVRVADQYPWPISPGEDTYISEKNSKALPHWEEYLSQAGLENFDTTRFLQSAKQRGGIAGETLPNVAFALSGGGNRALLYSAAILDAFDKRNSEAIKARTGGILQLANYITGLSAGSWLLTSWSTSGFQRMTEMNQTVWGINKHKGYFSWKLCKQLPKHYLEIRKKKKAGFAISFVDIWGRMLSEQYIDDPSDGERVLFSSVRNTTAYKDRAFPLPILVALSRRGIGQQITLRSPMYEFTPEDFNVWHPTFNGSIPIDFLGSKMYSATGNATFCVKGFENAGFVMASSSNVFSYQDGSDMSPNMGERFLSLFIKGAFYEALVPNPFQKEWGGVSTPRGEFDDSDHETLLLADGAMARENLPIFPLLQPARKIDTIIAVDATVNGYSFDNPGVDGYPNGTSLYLTYTKLQQPEFQNYHFPRIPNTLNSSFVSGGYNKRPTFFGCDIEEGPLVLYLPNYFVSDRTDMRTIQTDFTGDEIDGFFRNSFMIATQTKSTINDLQWPACLACALMDRQQKRGGAARTPQWYILWMMYENLFFQRLGVNDKDFN